MPAAPTTTVTVAEVLDRYLDWLGKQPHKAARTFAWYRDYLQSFLDSLADQFMPVGDLEPVHVYRWLDLHPNWTTGRRGAMVAVQRAFNWAVKAGLLKGTGGRSPLAGLEKPPQGRREQVLSAAEFEAVLGFVKDQPFCDLLWAAWDTGARPHELFSVEAAFVDLANSRWVFPLRVSKGKRHQRVVYLSERMLAVTRRLMDAHPTSPLFRNVDGAPWCVSSVKCRFQRLRVAMGTARVKELGLVPPPVRRLTAIERQDARRRRDHEAAVASRRRAIRELALGHAARYSLYSFRHSYCTRALTDAALDAVTVAALMGHRDTAMISRVYAHLNQRPGHLRDAANRSGGRTGA